MVCCLYPKCGSKFQSKGSTGTIINHLKSHGVSEGDVNDGQFRPKKKSTLDNMLERSNQGPEDAFTKERFHDALIHFIVHNKLPLSLANDRHFQQLLDLAHRSDSIKFIKLPSNDTLGRMVTRPFGMPNAVVWI